MNSKALSVSQLNTYVKSVFDADPNLRMVYVRGEISNFTVHMKSGHAYFTLKDENSAVKCVMFRDNAFKLRFVPKDGMSVTVRGRVTVFPRDGQYQLYAEDIAPDGLGSVYMAFLKLKDDLAKEGLFDDEHKKSLPQFPESIGVITSPTGAALQDILNISSRRFPMADIKIYPCTVQGDTAAASVRKALAFFNKEKNADVVIIARGGGSYEDLAAFNDEALARDVYASGIPVVSAIGHETDFTILDFVADRRAPTPSAAAELVCPDRLQFSAYINSVFSGIESSAERKIMFARKNLENTVKRLDVNNYINMKSSMLSALSERLSTSAKIFFDGKKNSFVFQAGRIESMNPMSVLLRGYSVVYKSGKTVRSVNDISKGDALKIRMKDGVIDCVAEKTGNDI